MIRSQFVEVRIQLVDITRVFRTNQITFDSLLKVSPCNGRSASELIEAFFTGKEKNSFRKMIERITVL